MGNELTEINSSANNSQSQQPVANIDQTAAAPAKDSSDQSCIEQPTESIEQLAENNNTGCITQPILLTKYISNSSLSFNSLNFLQLILVVADGSEASVYCYNKLESGIWNLENSLNRNSEPIAGHVGKNGVSSAKSEGDGYTPLGLYPLGFAFGIDKEPDTMMEYKLITKSSYWIDDPESPYYNKWVEGYKSSEWNSAEKLWEHTSSYAYAIVINYNMNPIEAGKGSAIFIHCGDRPTAGCVSVSQQNLLQILKWLDPNKLPYIFIVSAD